MGRRRRFHGPGMTTTKRKGCLAVAFVGDAGITFWILGMLDGKELDSVFRGRGCADLARGWRVKRVSRRWHERVMQRSLARRWGRVAGRYGHTNKKAICAGERLSRKV